MARELCTLANLIDARNEASALVVALVQREMMIDEDDPATGMGIIPVRNEKEITYRLGEMAAALGFRLEPIAAPVEEKAVA